MSDKIAKEIIVKGKGVFAGLVCRILDENGLQQINKLVASEYTANNPVREIFKTTKEDYGDLDFKTAEKYVKSGASLGFFAKQTEELVAVGLNSIHSKADGDPPHDVTAVSNERVATELRFYNYVFGDVFADLGTERYMRGRMICTNPEYRSIGLSAVIEQAICQLAGLRDCEYLLSIVGSHYLQKTTKAAGHTVLREVRYADYVDPKTGLKPDWKLSPIHTSCQLIYKRIKRPSKM